MHMQEEDLIRMNKVLRHRLRNSASGLKASITFLSKELSGRMQPQELEYFPLIQQECDAITAVTNRMQLLFDSVRPSPEIPLEEVLSAALAVVRAEFPTTAFDVDGAVTSACIAERDGLLIPLIDVLRNAAEAAPGGDVRVALETTPEGLTVCVRDGGPGFAGVEDPFLPFLTTKTRHLGLGLSIARKVAGRLGGTVAGKNDGGAVVTLFYPLNPGKTGLFGVPAT